MRKLAPRSDSPSLRARFSELKRPASFSQRDHFVFQFVQPIFKQDQKLRVGDGHQLPRLRHPVHQLLTHLRWIDTFVQAFRQSEVHHAGNLVLTSVADEIDHEIQPILIRNQRQDFFQCRPNFRQSFFRSHAV